MQSDAAAYKAVGGLHASPAFLSLATLGDQDLASPIVSFVSIVMIATGASFSTRDNSTINFSFSVTPQRG